MSLTITTPITINQGIELQTAYARVAVVNNITGTILEAGAQIYASEAAFEGGARPVSVEGLVLGAHKEYDYAVDGHDILDIAHDMMIEAFATQSITATKNL